MKPEQMRAGRIRKGWTQKELAGELGMSPGQICRMEKGTSSITEDSAKQLAEILYDGAAQYGLDSPSIVMSSPAEEALRLVKNYGPERELAAVEAAIEFVKKAR